jgi:hypothetical protein
MSESKTDICHCGDYRRSHNEKGVCQVCAWANPQNPCTSFRINMFADKAARLERAKEGE